jgi:pilus assembly protein CpaB
MSSYFGAQAAARRTNQERAMIVASLVVLLCSGIVGSALLLKPSKIVSPSEPVSEAPRALMTEVLIPRSDIESGRALSSELFRVESRPAAFLEPGTIKSLEEIKNQFAAAALFAGEPVVAKRVSPTRSQNPITPRIPGEARAVTIRVNDITSVDGLVRPGELVDVAWINSARGAPSLRIIAQNAQVIGADRQVNGSWQPGMPVPGTITLLAPTRESRYIQLAAQNGTLSLALRGQDAEIDPNESDVTLDEILRRESSTPETKQECRGKLLMSGEEWCLALDGSLTPRKVASNGN